MHVAGRVQVLIWGFSGPLNSGNLASRGSVHSSLTCKHYDPKRELEVRDALAGQLNLGIPVVPFSLFLGGGLRIKAEY